MLASFHSILTFLSDNDMLNTLGRLPVLHIVDFYTQYTTA